MARRNVPKGMMLMVHKNFRDRDPALVLVQMFENVWEKKGWEKFTETDSPQAAVPPSRSSGNEGTDDKPGSKPGD